ncbi:MULTISPECIES: MurR/RpiR family transcriptional regulator [Halocynthiibacter]|uniref:MurR/RpiR family transcriptional regulator n=1 Tax=Halocynthiibacter halioticoli TaxID=2986804 RepID=A0AAE3IZS3_9RHOB|nr:MULTISPECIES: MurR/RpiR family transcriptional regulator [Halocynthiibacter]MCV6825100.1 MurR/RpiR family transcriptional regulator [Halocynthiibacter halioticoli]MCW4058101.1 MurR/RpiR family transcriptional regulator [Halocynthiibacter sp. SDUM655004]
MSEAFDIKLASAYDGLSAKLKVAADFVAQHPVDVATRSLRAIAQESELAPATYSRLARALGYESFEALRDVIRLSINRRVSSFSQRAEKLQSEIGSRGPDNYLAAYRDACVDNIQSFAASVDPEILAETVEQLHNARRVLVLGALGSTGITEHMAYVANFVSPSWTLGGRMGASLGSGLETLDQEDAVIIVTKPPFAPRIIRAAELARERGAKVIVITDTHKCPALRYATTAFIVPSDGPHFFTSYTATLFFVETIVGMLASQGGEETRNRIAAVESNNRRLHEVRDAEA